MKARFVLALLSCLVGSLVAAEKLLTAKPNIVVFISDDHSQRDSQAYGSTEVRPPHMAKLAADGLKFTHAFVASPACGPSRTALLTGLWPARNGAERNHNAKRPEVPSLPAVLRSLGYKVATIGEVAHTDWAKLYNFAPALERNQQLFARRRAVATEPCGHPCDTRGARRSEETGAA